MKPAHLWAGFFLVHHGLPEKALASLNDRLCQMPRHANDVDSSQSRFLASDFESSFRTWAATCD